MVLISIAIPIFKVLKNLFIRKSKVPPRKSFQCTPPPLLLYNSQRRGVSNNLELYNQTYMDITLTGPLLKLSIT